jgi:hypothetical protein
MDERSRPETIKIVAGQVVLSDRLATFRRLYRWFNLTILQQGVWPMLLLIATAPAVAIAETPGGWYLARLAAPLLAAMLAWLYLRQTLLESSLQGEAPTYSLLTNVEPLPESRLAKQARIWLLGLPVMVAAARLLAGPAEPAFKPILFGAVQVAAFHLINFGVVPRSYRDPARGMAIGTLLFAISWAIHDALQVAAQPEAGAWSWALASGFVVGAGVALVCRFIRRWPGGALTAAAAHWFLIYLVFGFVD